MFRTGVQKDIFFKKGIGETSACAKGSKSCIPLMRIPLVSLAQTGKHLRQIRWPLSRETSLIVSEHTDDLRGHCAFQLILIGFASATQYDYHRRKGGRQDHHLALHRR